MHWLVVYGIGNSTEKTGDYLSPEEREMALYKYKQELRKLAEEAEQHLRIAEELDEKIRVLEGMK